MSSEREVQFLKLQEERLASLEKKKADRKEANTQNDQLHFFLTHFSSLHRTIDEDLESLVALTSDIEKKARLNSALEQAAQLQVLLNDSLASLPAYDLRKSQDTVTSLHEKIARVQQQCLPKKKFAFGKKKNVGNAPAVAEVKEVKDAVSKFSRYTGDVIYENRSNETIEIPKCEIYLKDVLLKNLTKCEVKLHSTMGTLHCTNCTDCTFSVGPISGSIFLENCSGSVYHVTCQQARIHSTNSAVFYIHVTSKAIIEDCKGLRFGKREEFYEGYEEDRAEAGLSDVNNWNDVDDFNWLNKEQSPNWEIIT